MDPRVIGWRVASDALLLPLDGGARLGRWGSVLFVRWPSRPTAAGVAALRRQVIADHEADVLVHVIDFKDIQVPDEAARVELQGLGRDGEIHLRAAAALVAHGGLVLATARATILGIRIAAGSKMPFEITDQPLTLSTFFARWAKTPTHDVAGILAALRTP